MPPKIDTTGLTDEAVRVLQTMADALRANPPRPSGPPPGDTAEAWAARWRAFVASRPRSDVIADDSRESIYERGDEGTSWSIRTCSSGRSSSGTRCT